MRATVLISALCLLFLAALCPVSAVPYANSGSLSKRYASPVIVARGAPSPSPSPRPHKIDFDFDFIRVPKVPTRKKFDARDQEQEIVMSPSEASQHLCPQPMTVCPITPNSAPSTLSEWDRDGFECVDTEEDLTSCGGCGFLDAKYDCTAIEGARTVSCVVGTCQVQSCRSGYTLGLDGLSCDRSG